MSKTSKQLSLALTILAIVSQPVFFTHAQVNSNLPDGLMFTASTQQSRSLPPISLIYVDPITSKETAFYTDQTTDNGGILRALKWNPQGDKLAVYRSQRDTRNTILFSNQICIINVSGSMNTCLADAPTTAGSGTGDPLQEVMWSSDGQSLYFESTDDKYIRLVQDSAVTSKQLKVIYERKIQSNESMPYIGWTSTLDYVLDGVGDYQGLAIPFAVDLRLNKTTPLDSQPTGASFKYFCVGFSPHDNYFAVVDNSNTDNPHLFIYNKSVQLAYQIDSSTPSGVATSSCPVWNWDESSFYIDGYGAQSSGDQLFEYVLATKQAKLVYDNSQNQLGAEMSPFILAPDGVAFTYNRSDNPDPRAGVSVGTLVDGKVTQYLKPYFYTFNSIWVPLNASLRIAIATCVTDSATAATLNSLADHKDWNAVIGTVSQPPASKIPPDCANELILLAQRLGGVAPTPSATAPSSVLKLTSLCSAAPDVSRVWRVHNPNAIGLSFTWDVYGTNQAGSGTVSANSDSIFQTTTVPNSPNTVRLFVNGVQQDVKASSPAQCAS